MSLFKKIGRETGIGMIEVLVTLIVLLIGLLGLAGTMVHSQRSETESYQRAQALVILDDMVARINANRRVASCYVVTTNTTDGVPFLGTSTNVTPACTTGTPLQQSLAIQDMEEWSELLLGAAELSKSDSNVGAMTGARGCVSFDATTGIYQVSVAWQGLGKTADPPATWTCGKGNYGDDKLRRVVSVTLKLADLS